MNMLKFLRGSGQPSPNKRQPPIKQPPEKQPELFAFRKTVQHGFPHKPTALAYDPVDRLMAIGTHSGAIKVFGQPGVEFYGQHLSATNRPDDCTVQMLEFVAGSGRVLSLTTANQLILWEPAGAMLVPIKTISFDGKLKKVSSLCCSSAKDVVWIGTEAGNVYELDLVRNFAVKESVIYQDAVLEQVPATYKLNPGAIEAVRQVPGNAQQLLIAYNRGLCVVWDLDEAAVVRSFVSPGHGQSVGVHIDADGEHFTWFHADGSYATWTLADGSAPIRPSTVPYGPDPCKSINGLVRGLRADHELIVFAGGMPRSAYGEHQCVSVQCADGSRTCLDFTSKVIDFFVTFRPDDERSAARQAEVLVVLLEEELCAFDLTDAALPAVRLPYLHSVHVSAVTATHLQSQVSAAVYERIVHAGAQQSDEQHSSALAWPITGGRLGGQAVADETPTGDGDAAPISREYEILLTGHEDGSVKFWDCTGVILAPLLHVRTAPLFGSGEAHGDQSSVSQEDLDEPPFRKAGFFDPYSDDPRFAIKKIALCPHSGQVIVAGTAGQIVVAALEHRVGEGPLRVTTMNLVSEGFVWKGHDQLTVRRQLTDDEVPPVADGLQVVGVLQVLPPAAINALALQSAWHLIAAGTAHGLVIFDYVQHHPVTHVCTLNPKDLSGSGEVLSRRKSFKKTLRESFRRLRRSRSTRTPGGGPPSAPVIETRPAERQIEARSTEDAATSMVRCLTFAQTHMFKNQPNKTFPSLWFGTYAYVCAYILYIPAQPAAGSVPAGAAIPPAQPTRAEKGKEITFKQHKAPIIGISVVDVHTGLPLDLATDADAFARTPHRVIIATEEQFKVFSLPELGVKDKYKLTAKEGVRIRRMSFARFAGTPARQSATATGPPDEVGMLCLTNAGDCIIFSVPDLKKKLNAAAVRREDINGISSLCFTNFGEALYMMSSSELQRVTLAANKVVALDGHVELSALNEPDTDADEQRSLVHRHDNRDAEEDDDDADVDNKSELMDATLATVTSRGGPSGDQLAAAAKAIGPQSNGSTLDMTTTSSLGDMTLDSIRDHLNTSTITTLHKQTTEEIVGRLAVLSTQTNQTTTALKMSDIGDCINLPNFKDLSAIGDTIETSTSSVVIKSVITSVTTNGDTTTHREEQDEHAEQNTTTTISSPNSDPADDGQSGDEQQNGLASETESQNGDDARSDDERHDENNGNAPVTSDDDGRESPNNNKPAMKKATKSATKSAIPIATRSPPQLLRKESQF